MIFRFPETLDYWNLVEVQRPDSHLPEASVQFSKLDPDEIDDGVVLGLVARMRVAGFQAFVMPQAPDLPMAGRREDVLIIRA